MGLEGTFDTKQPDHGSGGGRAEGPGRREYEVVWSITERNGREYWTRVGASFVNRDGSRTLLLDALPMNGKLQVRPPSEDSLAPRRPFSGNRHFSDDLAAG